jgi:hypothetical protein
MLFVEYKFDISSDGIVFADNDEWKITLEQTGWSEGDVMVVTKTKDGRIALKRVFSQNDNAKFH